MDFDTFSLQSVARTTPFILEDVAVSASHPGQRTKVLSEITNSYGSPKKAKKPAISTTVTKKKPENSPFFGLLSFPRTVFVRPSNVLFATSVPELWKNKTADNSQGLNCVNLSHKSFSVPILGSSVSNFLQGQRAQLAQFKRFTYKKISIDQDLFQKHLTQSGKIKPEIAKSLENISSYFHTEIYLSNEDPFTHAPQELALYVFGEDSRVSSALLRCKLCLDDARGLKVGSMEVDISLVSLVAGQKLANFKNIIRQTGVFIYVPELFCEDVFEDAANANQVFLTGPEARVLHAKYLLRQVISRAGKSLYFKDIRVPKQKLDHMRLHLADSVRKIMFENGSYIQLPSSGDRVRVQACSEHLVEKTLCELMTLLGTLYELEVSVEGSVDRNALELCLEKISETGTMSGVKYGETTSIKVFGNSADVVQALSVLKLLQQAKTVADELDVNVSLSSLTNATNSASKLTYRFAIEVLNSERDFICGKKNGKLLKIMNNTSTNILFEASNEYCFRVCISSDLVSNLAAGVSLLEMEFPAETAFHIPEIYHRQIIGVGGNLVQSIMRRYNVFIKFSNTFELEQGFLSFSRFDNVLIKCPRKNAASIPKVRRELEALVQNCQESSVNFRLTEDQCWLFLNNFKCSKVNDVEKATNSYISFPSVFGDQLVDIHAVDTRSAVDAFKSLSKELPKEKRFYVTAPISSSFNINKIISTSNEEFVEKIVIPFRIFLNTNVKVVSETELMLTYYQQGDNLKTATECLTQYLRSYDFKITKVEDVELGYNIVETKKPAFKKHGHSQSLNLNYKPVPTYKQTFLRSPPTYTSGPAAQFSPIECEVSSFGQVMNYKFPETGLSAPFNARKPHESR